MSKIYLIDKRVGWTSHDVVGKSKRLLNTKKVGHCGTLDPFATGLLVVFSNHATKLARFIEAEDKTYIATLKLGERTASGDTEGSVIETKEVPSLNEEIINNILASFIGKQSQLPPMYSALKVDGRRLYEYARENVEVERKAREIEIFDIKLLSYKENILEFEVSCSKGTYIRVLGEDIASRLNTVGHLIALRRTRIGAYKIEDAIDVEEVSKEKGIDLYHALSFMDRHFIKDEEYSDIFNGKDLIVNSDKQYVVVCDYHEHALAIYEKVGVNKYHCCRGLWGLR